MIVIDKLEYFGCRVQAFLPEEEAVVRSSFNMGVNLCVSSMLFALRISTFRWHCERQIYQHLLSKYLNGFLTCIGRYWSLLYMQCSPSIIHHLLAPSRRPVGLKYGRFFLFRHFLLVFSKCVLQQIKQCATWRHEALGCARVIFFLLSRKPNLEIHSLFRSIRALWIYNKHFTSESKSKREHPRPWNRSKSQAPWQRRIRWSWHYTSWWAHQQQQQSHQ